MDGYGGVFFACHNSINCTQIPIQIQCEGVACKVNLTDRNVLIVLTVYRPPNRDIQYMQNICEVIYRKPLSMRMLLCGLQVISTCQILIGV